MKDKSTTTFDSRTRQRGCEITININCKGDVHIYNCSSPPGKDDGCEGSLPPCQALDGSCIPAVAGAKHKLSRNQRLARIA